jgi:hypothetical protein
MRCLGAKMRPKKILFVVVKVTCIHSLIDLPIADVHSSQRVSSMLNVNMVCFAIS